MIYFYEMCLLLGLVMLQALLRICIMQSFFITILFHCRLSDVSLGRLVRGEDSDYLVSPIAGAVMELLEDLGELFYHEYSINSNVA